MHAIAYIDIESFTGDTKWDNIGPVIIYQVKNKDIFDLLPVLEKQGFEWNFFAPIK